MAGNLIKLLCIYNIVYYKWIDRFSQKVIVINWRVTWIICHIHQTSPTILVQAAIRSDVMRIFMYICSSNGTGVLEGWFDDNQLIGSGLMCLVHGWPKCNSGLIGPCILYYIEVWAGLGMTLLPTNNILTGGDLPITWMPVYGQTRCFTPYSPRYKLTSLSLIVILFSFCQFPYTKPMGCSDPFGIWCVSMAAMLI